MISITTSYPRSSKKCLSFLWPTWMATQMTIAARKTSLISASVVLSTAPLPKTAHTEMIWYPAIQTRNRKIVRRSVFIVVTIENWHENANKKTHSCGFYWRYLSKTATDLSSCILPSKHFALTSSGFIQRTVISSQSSSAWSWISKSDILK